jgi:rubrerythrin
MWNNEDMIEDPFPSSYSMSDQQFDEWIDKMHAEGHNVCTNCLHIFDEDGDCPVCGNSDIDRTKFI